MHKGIKLTQTVNTTSVIHGLHAGGWNSGEEANC